MNEQVQPASGEPLFNPLAPEFIRNPYPYYERLRRLDPMHVNAHGAFVASRHAEASLVLRDKRFGKDYVERSIRRYGPKIMDEPVIRSMSHWMLQQDPPDHTRLRGLVVKAFTARRAMASFTVTWPNAPITMPIETKISGRLFRLAAR